MRSTPRGCRAICAQDHGVPPQGVSHLDFRHTLYRERLDAQPLPQALLFAVGEIPSVMNRLQFMAESVRELPADEIYS